LLSGAGTRRWPTYDRAVVRRLPSLVALSVVMVLVAACSGPVPAPASSNFSELSGTGSLQMLNTRDGWTYGRDLVARTSDGARTLNAVTPPGVGGDSELVDPFFLDSIHAWIWRIVWNQSVLASATLERTSNGGGTWTAVPFQAAVVGTTTFLDPENGWMTTGRQLSNNTDVEDTLWRTSDGGTSWAAVFRSTYRLDIHPSAQSGGCYWLSNVAWTTITHGVAGVSCPFDAPPAVEITDDGGWTWKALRLPSLPARKGVALFEGVVQVHPLGGARLAALVSRCVGTDGTSCYPYGALYRSDDGGLSWTSGVVVERGSGLYMADADHAWIPDACAADPCDTAALLTTSDGGTSWRSIPLPQDLWPNLHGSRIYSVVSPLVVYVVATNAMAQTTDYYETQDGGRTFSRFQPRFVAHAGR